MTQHVSQRGKVRAKDPPISFSVEMFIHCGLFVCILRVCSKHRVRHLCVKHLQFHAASYSLIGHSFYCSKFSGANTAFAFSLSFIFITMWKSNGSYFSLFACARRWRRETWILLFSSSSISIFSLCVYVIRCTVSLRIYSKHVQSLPMKFISNILRKCELTDRPTICVFSINITQSQTPSLEIVCFQSARQSPFCR